MAVERRPYQFLTEKEAEEFIQKKKENSTPQYEELYFEGPMEIETPVGDRFLVRVTRYYG